MNAHVPTYSMPLDITKALQANEALMVPRMVRPCALAHDVSACTPDCGPRTYPSLGL